MSGRATTYVRRGAKALMLAISAALALAAWACHASSPAGHLPRHYRVEPAGYPWTGRLHAVTFRTARLDQRLDERLDGGFDARSADGHASVWSRWEAGRLLDLRDPASRRLYVGGTRMTALHWNALDDDARDRLAGGEPVSDDGRRRVSWLRGRHGMPDMRPRDTRLGHAGDARVQVVPPPIWQPLMPGHDAFRVAHARRPHTVWLGTRTGFLHGFDAITGHELTAFLPRALLAQAGALASFGDLQPMQVPCPRPDAIDADLGGTWRTLLLCGVPVLDDSDRAGSGGLGERAARSRHGYRGHRAGGREHARHLARGEPGERDAQYHADGADGLDEWSDAGEDEFGYGDARAHQDTHQAPHDRPHTGGHAASRHRPTPTIFALDITTPNAHRPLSLIWELAATDMLPLTGTGPLRAAAFIEQGVRRWYAVAIVAKTNPAQSGIALVPLDAPPPSTVRQILLPPHGCDGTRRAGRLLAVSVLADARAIARSIHGIDDLGQLWRFPLPLDASAKQPPACVLKLRGAASRRPEAPLILPGVVVPLIAVGSGSEVAVVPASPTAAAYAASVHTPVPRAVIRALRQTDAQGGVTLRADGATDHGWTFLLPHAGERFERWLPAGHAHVAFTTVSADGGRRSYLVDAMRGISPVVTGLPAGQGTPIVSIAPHLTDAATAPGVQRRDIETIALWTVDGDSARQQPPLQHVRKRGRLGWRELTRSSP